jgi:hypothetical protein
MGSEELQTLIGLGKSFKKSVTEFDALLIGEHSFRGQTEQTETKSLETLVQELEGRMSPLGFFGEGAKTFSLSDTNKKIQHYATLIRESLKSFDKINSEGIIKKDTQFFLGEAKKISGQASSIASLTSSFTHTYTSAMQGLPESEKARLDWYKGFRNETNVKMGIIKERGLKLARTSSEIVNLAKAIKEVMGKTFSEKIMLRVEKYPISSLYKIEMSLGSAFLFGGTTLGVHLTNSGTNFGENNIALLFPGLFWLLGILLLAFGGWGIHNAEKKRWALFAYHFKEAREFPLYDVKFKGEEKES